MASPPDLIEFQRDDPSAVLAVMAELAASREGWVNLSPEVDPDAELPRPPGLFALLSPRPSPVPLASWVPGPHARHGAEPISVGLTHGLGAKVMATLREAGLAPPADWTLVQDNRRGLVLALPEPAEHDHAAVLTWLIAAATVLCPAPLTGHWQAAVHGRA